jgi:hypothetical protein
MSDIKMSDVFGGSLINYSLSGVMTLTGIEKDAAIQAIEQHDAMQARIVELESLIKEADDYLNTNKLTTICNGSILHAAFKEAIKDEKGS